MYVLQRDLSKPGHAPYVLDAVNGDMPQSSIDVMVQLKAKSTSSSVDKEKTTASPLAPFKLRLNNYLSVPPPRTTRLTLIAKMLADQYPDQIPSAHKVERILFMPFVQPPSESTGGSSFIQGRSTSGGASSPSLEGLIRETTTLEAIVDNDTDDDDERDGIQYAKPEMSLRFPCIQMSSDEKLVDLRRTSSIRGQAFYLGNIMSRQNSSASTATSNNNISSGGTTSDKQGEVQQQNLPATELDADAVSVTVDPVSPSYQKPIQKFSWFPSFQSFQKCSK